MMFRNWWSQWKSRPAYKKPERKVALLLETLEDRNLLSFAGPAVLNLPGAPNAVATGHFEGASAPLDVVTADANGTVSVLLGNGDGTFGNPVNVRVGGNLTSVAVGDFLGNGLQDIAVADANGKVDVLLSNGNGTFQAPEIFSVGASPKGLAEGDFLGNGKLDIVTANANGTVSVLEGNGKGGFGSPITTQVGGNLTSVAVSDFNGDGKPDLVVGTSTGLDVLLGKGDGTFKVNQTVPFNLHYAGLLIPEAVTSVAVGDFRGDGKQDIVALANSRVSVLAGNGDGTFQDPVALAAGQNGVGSFAVGDFTGDGKLDVVTSNFAGTFFGAPAINLLAGNGDGTFQAARSMELGETANAIAVGAFTSSGKLDLALASSFGSNSVTPLLNQGGGVFSTTPVVAANVLPSAAAVGDFNGDGKQDIVTTGVAGNAVVLLSNGDGTFREGPTLTVSGSPDAVVVGDFNDDGKQDIAVGTEGGTIDVFLGNGNGTFQNAKVINLGINNSIQSIVAGDFNHDGHLDLAVTSNLLTQQTDKGLVTVFSGNGNGTFKKSQTINVGTEAEGLAAADFNNDGNLDLVTTSFLPDGTRNVEVLLGKGNGTFQAPLITTPGGSATAVAAGDFNNDGKQDLVLVDGRDNKVTVLLGNGDGTFGNPITTHVNHPVLGLGGRAVGDFFGDGKLSVAVTSGLNTVSVLRGNGDGTFQAPADFLVGFHGEEPSTVVAGDFNGDGKPDLAATNFLGDNVSTLLNTSPPPSHAAPAATTTSLALDTSTTVFGQQVTLTASVKSTGGTPTGSVTFFDGTTVLGEIALDPNGQASLAVTLGVGVHSLKASFAGIAPFTNSASASVSETVNKAATSITFTAGAVTLPSNAFDILSATVLPVAPGAGVPTGTVTFSEGSKVLGTAQLDNTGLASLFVTGLTKGKHTITATYSGDGDFLASTAVLVLNVT
jgi:hypothetical protein